MEDVKERMLRYLCDAYAVEDGGMRTLRGISEETDIPEMRATVDEHIGATQTHLSRLAQRIGELGGDVSKAKSFVNTIIGMASEMANAFHDKEDKLTQDLIKAYAFEHFEIGMYTSLRAFAEEVGDYDTAQLAESLMSEEQLAGERMLRLIPQVAKAAIIRTNVYKTAP